MENIVCEVCVIMCISTSYIVTLVTSFFDKFLEFRNDNIITAFAVSERAHAVIYFLTAVDPEHDIVHLAVHELLNLIIQQDTVSRHGKTEMLIVQLFLLPPISHQVFHNLPVHQRLPAEEVDFEIPPVPGILDQEIQCFLPHLE